MGIGGEFLTGEPGWPGPTQPCSSCKRAATTLFCRVDSDFMCLACDEDIHRPNKLASMHDRVRLCEVCEQVPATVTCQADAAALCSSCDADIHAVNPLAGRHHRLPIQPLHGLHLGAPSLLSLLLPPPYLPEDASVPEDPAGDVCEMVKPGVDALFDGPYLELDFGNPGRLDISGIDRRVPDHAKANSAPVDLPQEKCFHVDLIDRSAKPAGLLCIPAHSSNHPVSLPWQDFGVVPHESGLPRSQAYLSSSVGGEAARPSHEIQATPLSKMDREARVLRYKEKRKNRKFEKTIRYASRKAYAETRPRIRGRFVKRSQVEGDEVVDSIDGPCPSDFLVDSEFGVVPTF
ncbi:hypothetical protein SAY87_002007 [Trapa incisa]|uniref:CONSTANS-like protein n=1 Tax=Trapa incisa TaxID=236973 RepID=A0AAN7PUG5_9MYRT|nr:hypothetical protein SAY87_002007 [Trapa incisa]